MTSNPLAPPSLPPLEAVDAMPLAALPGFLLELAALQLRAGARLGALALQPPVPNSEADPDSLLDVDAAARFLSVAPSYVAELGRRRRLPRITHGKYVRFRHADLVAWIKLHRDPGVDDASASPYIAHRRPAHRTRKAN